MDAIRFDQVTRLLATIGTRRRLLGLLAMLPLLSGLLALLAEEEAAAKKRRKKRHKNKRKRKKRKNKKKRCTPESAAQTCAGRCATVTNNCQQTVDCGPCACTPACPACQTCDGATGQCGPNGAVEGQACGGVGEVCAQGTCRCGAAACLAAGGCCAGETCVATDFQTDLANCGACQTVCATDETCVGGTCCLPDSADLQAAVNAADPGATLTLCAGTWDLTGTVSTSKSLTLVGAGAGQTILDGGGAVRVLGIAAAAVRIEALTITKGSAAFGAGIFNAGTLTVRDAAVIGNSADNEGGGIYSTETVILEQGSRIAGNSAPNFGGGIVNNQGAVTLKAGSLIGGDVPPDANSASFGGGIYNNLGTVRMEAGSRITGNITSGGGDGGGIFNFGGLVTLEADALICENSAPDCAGVITGACPNPANGICPP